MRFSRLFVKTLRQAPAEADTVSHQLLLRAGMVQQVAAGVYAYLPLAWRVLRKIEQIIREEMDRAGGQELMMPGLQPVEIWEQSGRRDAFGKTLFTFTDRRDRRLCLGPTHEEVAAGLASRYVQSYRDLPLLLYHIQTKFRDEPRPRGGLLRVREFDMKDLYSFDVDEAGLDVSYKKMLQAYKNVYDRCGLPTVVVEADSGAIGGKESHEFMLIADSGEDEVFHCPACGYAANAEKAESVKPRLEAEEPASIEEVATPGIKTIEDLANFLGIPPSRTLKAVFYTADDQVVFVTIRGDFEVNETKLKNALKAHELRLASDAEVARAGLVAGYASPLGVHGIKTVGDDSIALGTNFVAGANKPDTHLRNVNYPRDFGVDILTDIALARVGDACPRCGERLQSIRGIEVGHVFKLGTFISERLGAYYLDKDGATRPIFMGSYGIGLGRLMAAAIEHSHDEQGIIWPLPIAPYHIYLCPLYTDDPEIERVAEDTYAQLEKAGFEVLFDDRRESPGVKFNDADLLGIPIRLTLSSRTLKQQSIELKWRSKKETELLPLSGLVETLKKLVGGSSEKANNRPQNRPRGLQSWQDCDIFYCKETYSEKWVKNPTFLLQGDGFSRMEA
ncbi:MAG TPA: proline--tRNA ligase [Dehalococcoidia bacterium]|nr:proline--tRNA ligase [Dehalococcoidia bacterium]